MMSGPVTCMVWEGTNAVKVGRMMLGETNPQARVRVRVRAGARARDRVRVRVRDMA